jgi:hypothetical protein
LKINPLDFYILFLNDREPKSQPFDANPATRNDDRSIISIIVKAIQQLANTVAGFADNFVSAYITATAIDAANGHFSNELCVGSTCVTPAQIQAMVAASEGSTPPRPNDSNSQTAPNTPPTITINGDNPAHIHVGDTYSDLGATIAAPQADLNLGIYTFVGTTPIDQVVIDTSSPATYHINYVATDQAGNIATSTWTIIVEALFPPTLPEVTATSTLDAAFQ